MTLRAVVVDDEAHARAELTRLLVALGVEVIGEAADGWAAARVAAALRPDVLFLDVNIPGIDGLSLAARGGLPPVVFVTAHAAHAPEAFDLDACDFVLKPVSSERLERALRRVARRVQLEAQPGAPSRLRVTDAKGTRWVDARRVEVFSAVDKYVAFDDAGEELLLRESLDELEERLAAEGFVRAHRAHLVRASAVVRADDGARGLVLVLASGREVPVSKRARAAVLRALG